MYIDMVHIELNPVCIENILIVFLESTSLFSIGLHRTLLKPCFFLGLRCLLEGILHCLWYKIYFYTILNKLGPWEKKVAIVMVNFQYVIISQCNKRPLMRKETMEVYQQNLEENCVVFLLLQLHLSVILE